MKNRKKKGLLWIGIAVLAVIAVSVVFLRPENVVETEDLWIVVDQDTVTPEGLTYTIINELDRIVEYPPNYSVEKQGIFGWRKLAANPLQFVDAVMYIVTENSQRSDSIMWKGVYGKLSPGTYRLVREIDGKYLAGEFTVP